MIKNLTELEAVLDKEISNLMEISPAYLSDAGKAALEAYKAVHWHCCCFFSNLTDLISDEHYQALSTIEGKHPEYYNVLRIVTRAALKAAERE